jgi:hypothetical protein
MQQFAPEVHTDMLMEMIEKDDPEHFEYLVELRETNPEEFLVVLEDTADHYRNQMPNSPEREFSRRNQREHRERRPGPDRRPGRRPIGLGIQRLEEHLEEYMEWLEENYPEEAELLENAREEEPNSFRRRLRMSIEKFGHIYKTSIENPELAEMLKEDMELKQLRNEILEELTEAEENEKEWLQEQLKDVVNKRFDIIMQRKQFHYNMLKQKLEELQKELQMREEELDKLKQKKNQAVEERLSELLGKSETINWD